MRKTEEYRIHKKEAIILKEERRMTRRNNKENKNSDSRKNNFKPYEIRKINRRKTHNKGSTDI